MIRSFSWSPGLGYFCLDSQIDIRLVAKELDDKHPNLHVITLEVTDYAAFPALVKKVGKRLDYNFCE